MRIMEDLMSAQSQTLSSVEITTNSAVVEKLLQAVVKMSGEAAAKMACGVGDTIEDSLLYDGAGWGRRASEILNHHAAIIMLFSGDMCQQQYEELFEYEELLSASQSEINLIVITPDRASRRSCVAQAVMEDEPIFDDKNNLIFDMEVDINETEDVADKAATEEPRQYKLLSDVDGNFARKHRLNYSINDEVCAIFEDDFSMEVERETIIPAIYIVDEEQKILFANLNADKYLRPTPNSIIEQYRQLTTER